MRELRTAVIGIGNMGTAHARCIREGEIPGLELAAVCDLRPERLRWVEANWPGVARTADWRSLLDPALPLDAVIIAVPHPLHCEIAHAFLEAGKHVLSEKPLDIRLSRARKAVAAAEEQGLVVITTKATAFSACGMLYAEGLRGVPVPLEWNTEDDA